MKLRMMHQATNWLIPRFDVTIKGEGDKGAALRAHVSSSRKHAVDDLR